jgi:hypothetical protein
VLPDDNRFTEVEGPFLDQDGGNRPPSLMELRFNDPAARLAVRICLQFQDLCLQQDVI